MNFQWMKLSKIVLIICLKERRNFLILTRQNFFIVICDEMLVSSLFHHFFKLATFPLKMQSFICCLVMYLNVLKVHFRFLRFFFAPNFLYPDFYHSQTMEEQVWETYNFCWTCHLNSNWIMENFWPHLIWWKLFYFFIHFQLSFFLRYFRLVYQLFSLHLERSMKNLSNEILIISRNDDKFPLNILWWCWWQTDTWRHKTMILLFIRNRFHVFPLSFRFFATLTKHFSLSQFADSLNFHKFSTFFISFLEFSTKRKEEKQKNHIRQVSFIFTHSTSISSFSTL